MSVNKAILVGRLGKDPECRYMTNGEAVTNVSLATSENYKDKEGNKQERTEWHNLVFYRRLAEIAGEYLQKGAQVYVEGKLQTRKWQDKEGKDRYTTEIVVNEMRMLGGKREGAGDPAEHHSGARQVQHPSADKPAKPAAPAGNGSFDDDIPFADPYKFTWRVQ